MSIVIITKGGKLFSVKDATFVTEPFPHLWWRTVEKDISHGDIRFHHWLHEVPLEAIERISRLEKTVDSEGVEIDS